MAVNLGAIPPVVAPAVPQSDGFDGQVESASGSKFDDVILGDNRTDLRPVLAGVALNPLDNQLRQLKNADGSDMVKGLWSGTGAVFSAGLLGKNDLFVTEGTSRNLAFGNLLMGVGGAVFSLVWILVRAGVGEWLFPAHRLEKPLHELIRYVLVATFFFNMLVYWVVVTVAHVVAYSESLRERERRLVELEGRLSSARLMALQMQLNPHFLFNALNGIGTLMFRDVEAADAMLVRLAELLRHALDRSGRQWVSLREEMAFIDRYLTLEQMRFGDRLSVSRELAPEVLEAQVPNLILQPLVENAIKHGVEPLLIPGRIVIRASEPSPGRLRLEVQDNGKGLPPDRSLGLGVGTSNTLARLNQLHGAEAVFRLEPVPEGGVLAVVELPLSRPAQSPASETARRLDSFDTDGTVGRCP
jgi:signal transduction histidine kinase